MTSVLLAVSFSVLRSGEAADADRKRVAGSFSRGCFLFWEYAFPLFDEGADRLPLFLLDCLNGGGEFLCWKCATKRGDAGSVILLHVRDFIGDVRRRSYFLVVLFAVWSN